MERLTIDHLNIEQWTGLEKWHLKYSEKIKKNLKSIILKGYLYPLEGSRKSLQLMFWYDFDFWIIKNINSLSWNDFREFPIPVTQSHSPGANTGNRTSFIRG